MNPLVRLPTFTRTTFPVRNGMIIANQMALGIAFPCPIPMVKLSHIIFGYEDWRQRRYCLPDFVEVEVGDVVVDCGAYVGGFSISAAERPRKWDGFEPESGNFGALCAISVVSTTLL